MNNAVVGFDDFQRLCKRLKAVGLTFNLYLLQERKPEAKLVLMIFKDYVKDQYGKVLMIQIDYEKDQHAKPSLYKRIRQDLRERKEKTEKSEPRAEARILQLIKLRRTIYNGA